MERLGCAKPGWPGRFSPFAEGIPSHDTIRYVMGLVDPAELQEPVVTFLVENTCAAGRSPGAEESTRQYVVDGKAERGTGRRHEHSETI